MVTTQFQDIEGLTSLAILKVNWDENRSSYIDNFLPFVKEALRRGESDVVSAPQLQEELEDLTGLKIPQPVVSRMLKRARKKESFLEYSSRTRSYRRTDAVFEGDSLNKTAQKFQRQSHKLVEKLKTYSEKEFGVVWSLEEAEDLLFSYLQRFAAPVVTATRTGETGNLRRNETKKDEYVISAFIQRCIQAEPELFRYLEDLAVGNMVASAVYYESPHSTAQHYNDVDIYLDTPILLFLLGVNGDTMREAYVELINLLKDAGANLCAFKITIDETRGVLDATAASTRSSREARIPSASNPVQSQLPSSDLKLVSRELETRLKQMRITPVERPEYESWLGEQISEKELQEGLAERYSSDKPDMLRHDVQAVVSIHYARKGRKPGSLTSAGAIFVTNNSFLARTATQFFTNEIGRAAKDVPHCMMYDELATRTWLMSPNAAPSLPRKQLLAHAYAAMLPDDGLVEKYLAELDRLRENGEINQDSYLYFRSAEGIGELLTDSTLNDEDAFTEATVQEIIQRREAEIRATTEEERDEQRERAVEAEKKAEKERKERERTEAERNQERQRAQEAEERAEESERTNRRRENRIRQFATVAASSVDWGIRMILFFLLGIAAYVGLPNLPKNQDSVAWSFVFAIGIAVLAVTGLINAFTKARSWSRKAGDWVEQRILKFFSISATPPENRS